MKGTSYGVRDALDTLTDTRPPLRTSVDDVVRAGRRLRSRRRLAVAGSSLLAAALVAGAGIPAALSSAKPPAGAGALNSAGASSTAPAFPALDAPFMYSIKGYSHGPVHVSDPVFATATYQESTVTLDGVAKLVETNSSGTWRREYDQPVGILTVFRPGVFSPDRFQNGTKVAVNGLPGLLAEFDATVYDTAPRGKSAKPDHVGHHTVRVPALAWQYAAGAWATITTNPLFKTSDPAKDLLALAAGLAPAQPRQVRVPYRFRNVPAGYHLVGVGSFDPGDAGDDISEAYFARTEVPVSHLTGRLAMDQLTDARGVLKIILAETAPAAPSDPFPHPNPKHPCQAGFCDRAVNDKYFAEVLESSDNMSVVHHTTDALVFDNPADPTTWHEVGDLGLAK